MTERGPTGAGHDPRRLLRVLEQLVEARPASIEERIARLCNGDRDFEVELRALLADLPEGFLETQSGLAGFEPSLPRTSERPEVAALLGGKYRLDERIAAGAMGGSCIAARTRAPGAPSRSSCCTRPAPARSRSSRGW